MKILKEKLPELQVLPHLISSNTFRQKILDAEFLEGISSLAKYGYDTNINYKVNMFYHNFFSFCSEFFKNFCSNFFNFVFNIFSNIIEEIPQKIRIISKQIQL